ncbi:hypothetical protein EMCRGX_G027945, partial [Ephydatia muelleri]
CAKKEMPATLEQTTADPSVVDVTCESERSEDHCVSSRHSRSASGSSEGSQPSSPRETSEKKGMTRSCSVKKPKSVSAVETTSYREYTVSEQTQLLLKKMLFLEQKLQSMETDLKTEREHRLTLEVKVTRLEEENAKLKKNKVQASQQLHEFAEKFFSYSDSIKGSPFSSPHPSLTELRASRSSSVSSSSYDPRSRLSGISM